MLSGPHSSLDLVKAVHVLMGQPVPASQDALSPISRARNAQHHTDALLAEAANAAEAADACRPLAELQADASVSATAPREADALFDQSMDILTRHMQRMGLQPELPGRLLASDPSVLPVAAAIAPLAQVVTSLQSELGGLRRGMTQLQAQLTSKDSFVPLAAIAITQLSQQVHGMQKMMAAMYQHSGQYSHGSVRPVPPKGAKQAIGSSIDAQPDPAASPARKQANKAQKSFDLARKQIRDAAERMPQAQAGPSHADALSAMPPSAAAVLGGPLHAGVQIVYPGRNGEPYWVTWNGRQVCYASSQALVFICIAGRKAACTSVSMSLPNTGMSIHDSKYKYNSDCIHQHHHHHKFSLPACVTVKVPYILVLTVRRQSMTCACQHIVHVCEDTRCQFTQCTCLLMHHRREHMFPKECKGDMAISNSQPSQDLGFHEHSWLS